MDHKDLIYKSQVLPTINTPFTVKHITRFEDYRLLQSTPPSIREDDSETEGAAIRTDPTGCKQYVLLNSNKFRQGSSLYCSHLNFDPTTKIQSCYSTKDGQVYYLRGCRQCSGQPQLDCNGGQSMLAGNGKRTRTRSSVKLDPRDRIIANLKREITKFRHENKNLKYQLNILNRPTWQRQKENDDKILRLMKEQQQKEAGLYKMIQEYMVENEAIRAENSELYFAQEKSREEQSLLYRENEELLRRFVELERKTAELHGVWSLEVRFQEKS